MRRALYIHELHQQYGPIVRIAPREVAFADIEAYRLIHRIGTPFLKDAWYQRLSPTQDNEEKCGLFMIQGHRTANARRTMFQKAGHKSAVARWEPEVVTFVDQTVARMKSLGNDGSAVDIFKWWSMMAADVIGRLAFGCSFKVVERGKTTQLLDDINTSLIISGIKAEVPIVWTVMKTIPLPPFVKLVNIFDKMTQGANALLNRSKTDRRGVATTLFSYMVPDNPAEQQLQDSVVVQEAVNMIIAGSDTTAITLTYLIYAVLRQPDIQDRLVKELALYPEDADWKILEKLPHLNNVITEALRVYSAVPGSLRRVSPFSPAKLGGFRIPAGTTVATQAYTFHRDPTVWVDPDKFNPDRWNNPTPAMKEYFMPWGGSSRVCLGQNIARLEMLHGVSKFFRAFPKARLAPRTTPKSMEMEEIFIMKPTSHRCEVFVH